jgi:DNA-binding NtrC family response regulator
MTALRILHVDDESDIREVLEISLGLDPDITTRECASGTEALLRLDTRYYPAGSNDSGHGRRNNDPGTLEETIVKQSRVV